jgi:predicted glycogen debranching enzyme
VSGCDAPRFIRFGREICGELELAERREWWLANGRGGYACGTVAGSLTRRYHGLLVAPLHPPLGRALLAVKTDATLRCGERSWPLFTNRWAGGVVEPSGYLQLQCFGLEGRMPVWRFAIADLLLEQRIWMEHASDTTCIAFRLLAAPLDATPELHIALLANCRDHHQVSEHQSLSPTIATDDGATLRVGFDPDCTLHIHASGGELCADRTWIEAFDLPLERERGLEYRDQHLRIGFARLGLSAQAWCGLALQRAAEPVSLQASLEGFLLRERRLLASAGTVLGPLPDWIAQLVLAADSFVFARPLPDGGHGVSVIAGYPWFGDWGRDTMIALAGLTLATGRHHTALRILETFAGFVDGGMVPNLFPGRGEQPQYHSADAALWYIEAWRAYLDATDDRASLARHYPVLQAIVEHYRNGTRFGIGMDPQDGLICCADPGVQLTWMDASVAGRVVTPRTGKPVEINALWYNALCIMTDFAGRLHDQQTDYAQLAARVSVGFARYRRDPDAGLYDVLDGPGGDDASIRPNQILAVSLTHSALEPDEQAAVVAECGRELLCGTGLRSLASGRRDYRAVYSGDVLARDSAYHQGPVWGWLLGHYVMAEYRVSGDPCLARQRLEALRDHLFDAGLGTVSEIFDATEPHRPRGAPAQAWSVACTLQAWWQVQGPVGRALRKPPA